MLIRENINVTAHFISTFSERVNIATISKEKEGMLIQIGVRICCLMSFAKCFIFKIMTCVK